MNKHVYWQESDETSFSLCCDHPKDDPIHVPDRITALKHGDRVYMRQVVTPEAINSILQRLDDLEIQRL